MQLLLTCFCIYVNEVALSLDSVIFLRVDVTLCVFLVLFGIVAISLFRCFTMRYVTTVTVTARKSEGPIVRRSDSPKAR